jgi:hypothetical protein
LGEIVGKSGGKTGNNRKDEKKCKEIKQFFKKLSDTNSPNKNYTSNYRIQVPLFKGDLGGSNFCSQILENWYDYTIFYSP